MLRTAGIVKQAALLFAALLLLGSLSVLAKPNAHAAASGEAPALTRIALVIGNAGYPGNALKNPVNDADGMAAALRKLGFDVIEKTDASQKEMNRAITQFGAKLNRNTVALFYYAGHGLQVRGKNYLIPVDALITTEQSVSAEAVDVDTVLNQFSASPISIIILDACRTNPFERSFRSVGGGLAQMDAPKGTLIEYATAPGRTAADGQGSNGLYTQELLKALNEPGLKVEEVFKHVRTGVARQTDDAQIPWEASSLTGDFCFGQCGQSGTVVASLEPVPAAPTASGINLDDIQKQQEARTQWDKWQTAMKADYEKVVGLNVEAKLQVTAWERFLAAYPQKNPYSDEDDGLRNEARRRKQSAEAESQRRPQVAVIQQTTPSAPSGPFKDCSDCPEMVVIPSGSFMMGSPASEAGRHESERPQHPVSVRSYALGKTHVTRGQYAAFVTDSGYQSGTSCWTVEGGKFQYTPGRTWKNPGFAQRDDEPVVCVNWEDTQAYVKWLSGKTGKTYRLPSEAEWEYACRAGQQQLYCGGNSGDSIHPVAKKQANAWGLVDMSGNAFEWTQDCYHDSYSGAPSDGSAWLSESCEYRVLRGGSWDDTPQRVRSAIRYRDDPGSRDNSSGFRVARTLN